MTAILSAQTAHKLLRSGDKSYDQQNYSKAEEDYRKAVNKDNSPKSNYNLGNAVYQQEKYKEAVKHFQTSAQNATNEGVKSKAFYNMGNAHLNAYQKAEGEEVKEKEQHLKDAIDSYKQALRHNPKDMDSKHNLTMAMQQMRQQQQQKQQNQNKDKQDKSDDNKEDDKNKQQENEKDGKQEEEKDQGEKEDGEQDKNKPEEKDGEKDGQQISKKEAEKLLEIMNDEERKVQEKLNKSKSKKRKSDKDW